MLRSRFPLVVTVLVAVVAVVALAIFLFRGATTKHATAYFGEVKGVYVKDTVRILGVAVGKIDKITPEGDRVRVDFHYDGKYSLPATAGAAIVSPTLVATRYLQIAPAYSGGPKLAEDGVIPMERTTEPVEFDELKKQLDQVALALGPQGANKTGSLTRFLDVAAQNADGQGERFNQTITQLSHAIETISRGRGDLFSTVRNLQVFVQALNLSADQIVEFQSRLDDVSGILAENRGEFGEVLRQFDEVSAQVTDFVQENRDRIDHTTDNAGQLARTLASLRDDIALVLHVGGPAVQNAINIMSGSTDSPTGALVTAQLQTPASFICNAMAAAATPDPKTATDNCQKYLGPLANQLAVQESPIGLSPIRRPGGGGVPVPSGAEHFAGPNGPRPADGTPFPGQAGAPPPDAPAAPSLPNLLLPGGGK
ncbi:MCE family protein [Pseudonocardia spinosispora]|uniref:MCE family protein n=1 Tax=Pseudonocardia spinosispora TaxID=103441 RepID=UPI0006852DEC|nr:MCE family protein [Pseudonocardia spinosispora]